MSNLHLFRFLSFIRGWTWIVIPLFILSTSDYAMADGFGKREISLATHLMSLGKLEKDTRIFQGSLIVSPDMNRIGYVSESEKGQFVSMNEIRGPLFDSIGMGTPIFSAAGNAYAYTGSMDKQWVVVLNGRMSTSFEMAGNLQFSPDGNRLAYIVKTGNSHVVMLDDAPGPKYDSIVLNHGLVFSPDSKHLMYAALWMKRMVMVKDGSMVDKGEFVGRPMFSPDSKRFVFTLKEGDQEYLVVDGERKYCHEQIANIRFSPDSQKLAYAAKNKEAWELMVDGKKIADGEEVSPLLFSLDSKRVGYAVKRKGSWQGYIDGKRGISFDEFLTLEFSPDAKRHAATGKVRGKFRVIVDDTVSDLYDAVGAPVFSEDSRRVGYQAASGKEMFAVVDEKPFQKGEMIYGPVFSPDSKHFAYTVLKDKKFSLYVDGEPMAEHDIILNAAFSPDSRHIVYMAMQDNHWSIGVNGKNAASDGYEAFVRNGTIVFDGPNRFHSIALRSNQEDGVIEFVKVGITITE